VPDLTGKRVVDLGCGFGWFSHWAAEHGASSVLGLDLSEKMLLRARNGTDDGRIVYERADLETLVFPDAAFAFAYSALAFHHVNEWGPTAAQVVAQPSLVQEIDRPMMVIVRAARV
jgi:ubiquinone/menaquinone biosynthesis C-methylase UbiE